MCVCDVFVCVCLGMAMIKCMVGWVFSMGVRVVIWVGPLRA